jgi:hypothetical protein
VPGEGDLTFTAIGEGQAVIGECSGLRDKGNHSACAWSCGWRGHVRCRELERFVLAHCRPASDKRDVTLRAETVRQSGECVDDYSSGVGEHRALREGNDGVGPAAKHCGWFGSVHNRQDSGQEVELDCFVVEMTAPRGKLGRPEPNPRCCRVVSLLCGDRALDSDGHRRGVVVFCIGGASQRLLEKLYGVGRVGVPQEAGKTEGAIRDGRRTSLRRASAKASAAMAAAWGSPAMPAFTDCMLRANAVS